MTQQLVIERWLPEAISNGSHGHWSVKRAKLREAQDMAYASAREAGWQRIDGKVHLAIHYVFPDRRRRDLDNLVARSKGVIDGLKEHFFEDDSMDVLTLEVSAAVEPKRKALVVTLEARP